MAVILFALILIVIDQFSKYLVVMTLKGQAPKVIIDGFMNLYYLENKGAAFGMLQNKSLLFTIITIIVVVVLLNVLFKDYHKNTKSLNIAIGLILGGSIGNFIDRLRLGYVVDFISTNIFGYDFAVFNLADTFIVIGTIIFIIIVLLFDNSGKKRHERR